MSEHDVNNKERVIAGSNETTSSDTYIQRELRSIVQGIQATGQVVEGDILTPRLIGTVAEPPVEQSTILPISYKQLTPNSSCLGLILRQERLEKKAA